jgi:hypothetical protein
MEKMYKQHKSTADAYNLHENNEIANSSKLEEIRNWAYNNISSNSSELANLSIYLCYKNYPTNSKGFCWKVFGNEIVSNLIENGYDRAYIPLLDNTGDISYLNKKYSNLAVKINGV